jgi:perosamine synthetase
MIGVGGLRLGRNTERYIAEVLATRRFSYGPFLEKFEQAMATAHGVRFAIMSNSGTSSLQVGLQAMKERAGWGDGDEVIVPAVTFVATANVVIHNRMRPVFVDIEPDYYGLDPEKIEAAITPRTRAIFPVHLFGQSADMSPIMDIAKRHGLRVIEDSCETMFARYNGKSVGSFGDCAGFSTYVAHLISTGVGGLTLTDDPDLAMRIRSLVNHGRDSIYISIDDDKNKSDEAMKMIIARRFSFVGIGHSFRATEFEGAVGLAQIEERDEMISARRANAARLTAGLKDLGDRIVLPKIRPGSDHSFMMYPIVLREGSKALVTKAIEDRGIETRDMLPLVNQPVYKTLYGTREEDYPVAHNINRMGFYVGSHPDVTEKDLDHMVEVLHDVLSSATAAVAPAAAPPRAALVLTSHNDAEAAERLLMRIPQGVFDETVAIDAGSSDGTPQILAKAGFKVTGVERGRRASQFEEGLRRTTAEHVIFLSLDGSEDPAETERLLFHLRKGADMVIASRYLPGARRSDHGKVLSPRGWGNRMLALAFNLKYGMNLSDPHNGLRGIRRGAFSFDRLHAPGFTAGWAMSLIAGEKHMRVEEIPTWEGPRRQPRAIGSLLTNGLFAIGMLLRSRPTPR